MNAAVMATMSELAGWTAGELRGADAAFVGVSTDTRTLRAGELFVALRGPRFDARDFVAQAASAGAAGVLLEASTDTNLPQVVVADAHRALIEFARTWRRRFDVPLVAVTGSNGKTTIKELIAAILRVSCAGTAVTDTVMATRGNFNNDIGVPLTLLRLRAHHRAAVIEMGASGPGEIAGLAAMAAPAVAVISNAGRAHLEGFGSLEGVAAAKGEILDGLSASGTAVLNRDDRFYLAWKTRCGDRPSVSFGMDPAADFHATGIRPLSDEQTSYFAFEMHTPAGNIPVHLPLAGRQNILNALAAAAAAMAAGATLSDVQAGLAGSSNVAGRMRSFASAAGARIFDDSYNANPDSVLAAIRSLRELEGETWLVLGDMGELGPDAAALHAALGEAARKAGVHGLLCIGELSRHTAAAFGPDARWFDDMAELQRAVHQLLRPGRNVLVKASRFMGLERVVNSISEDTGAAAGPGLQERAQCC